jgi:hypothetical protein
MPKAKRMFRRRYVPSFPAEKTVVNLTAMMTISHPPRRVL